VTIAFALTIDPPVLLTLLTALFVASVGLAVFATDRIRQTEQR
jgi:hypothetical protein